MAAETKVIISAEDRTQRAFSSARGNLKKFHGEVKAFAKAFAGAFVVAGIVQGLARVSRAANEAADQLQTLSTQTGITAEDLSRLSHFANQNETSIETLTGALKRLAAQQFDAAKGTKQQAELFAALGIEVRDAEGNLRAPLEVLLDLADVFQQLPDGATKTAVAVRLLGKAAGPELTAALSQGRTGIEAYFKEADRLGITVSEKAVKAVDDLNDSLTKLQQQATARALNTFSPWIEQAARFVDKLTELGAKRKELDDAAARGASGSWESGASGSWDRGASGSWARRRTNAGRPSLPKQPALSEADILAALEEKRDAKPKKAGRTGPTPVERLIAQAMEERDTFGASARAIALYRAELEHATQEQLELLGAIYDVIEAKEADRQADEDAQAALRGIAAAAERAAEESRRYAEEQDAAAEAVRDSLDPMRPYLRELADLVLLHRQGRLSADEFRQASEALSERMRKAAEEANKAAGELSQFALQAARNIQTTLADFLFDPFADGLNGMVRGFADALRRMAAEALAAELGKKLLGDFGTKGADVGGLLGKLLGFFSFAHAGGIIGATLPRMRASALAFADAPRYHTGGVIGLKPNEKPIIGEIGEEVLTKDDPRHRNNGGGASAVRIVNVIDPAMAADYLDSSAGERTILNVLQRNAGAVRQILS